MVHTMVCRMTDRSIETGGVYERSVHLPGKRCVSCAG
jgi:hypothetical protein